MHRQRYLSWENWAYSSDFDASFQNIHGWRLSRTLVQTDLCGTLFWYPSHEVDSTGATAKRPPCPPDTYPFIVSIRALKPRLLGDPCRGGFEEGNDVEADAIMPRGTPPSGWYSE